jgi:hypothetical protein
LQVAAHRISNPLFRSVGTIREAGRRRTRRHWNRVDGLTFYDCLPGSEQAQRQPARVDGGGEMAERKDGGDSVPQKEKQMAGAAAGTTGAAANLASKSGASSSQAAGSQAAGGGATSAGVGTAAGASLGDKGNGDRGAGNERGSRGGSQGGPDVAAAAHEAMKNPRGVADQFAGEIRGAAESLLDEGKDRAIDTVHGVAQALRKTAEGLQEAEGGEFVARYAEQAADQIERFTESMRDRHLTDVVADLDDFARRQPTLFLVGAVAAGFIVGRFMSASGDRRRHEAATYGRTSPGHASQGRASRDGGAQGRAGGMAGYGAGAYGSTRGNA